MELADCKVGFGITGSFCTFAKITKELKILAGDVADITPVFSNNVQNINSRF